MRGAFQSLECLCVMNCPKLKGHLPEQLSYLKELIIKDCEQLVASIPRAVEIGGVKMEEAYSFDMIGPLVSHTPLKCLRIDSCPGMNIPINHWYSLLEELDISKGCDSLTSFPLDLFPKLCSLGLDECHNLHMISQEHLHTDLVSLKINNCSEFESFPNDGLFAPQLETFYIEGLEKLKTMPKRMSSLLPSLGELTICNCPRVDLSEGCLPSNLEDMHLSNCSKLVVSLKGAWESTCL
ncbi:hypothetical protein DEO72_LG3g252 [Vigna unguiculata]|uniref:Disease resistance protein RPM1 n=1 Tax=Vigna unguiculata TaxID=3917 RepID=A0A4D6LAY1_VIGUN|nr:hypothetical protein DEO72_LG3g252 [Vigna unguiculata]